MTLRIGVDCDGVLYRWDDTARFLIEAHWGITIPPSDDWDFIKEKAGPDAWNWLWTTGVRKHGLFRHGNLYKGSVEAMKVLEKAGHRLVLITSRPSYAAGDTFEFVAHHRLPFQEVIICERNAAKSEVQHCDLYIDDGPHNIEDLLMHTRGRVLMWDRPWNKKYEYLEWGERYARVSSWAEVLEYTKRDLLRSQEGDEEGI